MSLQDVLIDEMRDLYSAENQLVKALPKTVKAVSDDKLKQLLTEHLEQTKGQVQRLRQVFEKLGKKPTGKHCSGMEGCIKEVTEALEEDEDEALMDAGIIGASLRTEHYEIAGYSAAIAMAKTLKETEIVQLLTESLKEEQAAAKNILASAPAILKAADAQEDEEEDDEEDEDEEKILKSRSPRKKARRTRRKPLRSLQRSHAKPQRSDIDSGRRRKPPLPREPA